MYYKTKQETCVNVDWWCSQCPHIETAERSPLCEWFMGHQTDIVHSQFFHIWALSELYCHLNYRGLEKAILMKKKTRRVAFFATKISNSRFWRAGKNWPPYKTPCKAHAANLTFTIKIFGVCRDIHCGRRFMTTLIVYKQAWRKKDIICAKQRGTLYVQFHHGPSNLFSGICYRGRSMHIHNIMCLIHLQYNLSRYQLAQGINDWVIASGSCLYVSFKQNSIPHFIVTDNISSLYEQNSSAVFKNKMQ